MGEDPQREEALRVKCDRCGRQLGAPGGLAFSPPNDVSGMVCKLHLCRDCWKEFTKWLLTRS